MLKLVGATAATAGLGGALSGSAMAAPSPGDDVGSYLAPDGEVRIPAGEYTWDGSGLDIGSGAAVVGEGDPGEVVWNLESGSMDGTIAGRLENVVVRGDNPEAKSGLNLEPGGEIDGFCWPEGGNNDEDRALYHPDGGERAFLVNSAWGGCGNNGAYIDKSPMTIENCVGLNNNVANLRVGHRDGGDPSDTTYVRNSLFGATSSVRYTGEIDSENAIGLRVRHPCDLVVENCWFVYTEGATSADAMIEIHDRAEGMTATFRNCHFHNDTDIDLIQNQPDADVEFVDCTVSGSGSTDVPGATEQSKTVPLPSTITGIPQADELYGFDPSVQPFGDDAAVPDDTSPDESEEPADEPSTDTIVLHASPDNAGDVDVSFVVDGDASYASEAEAGTDTIESSGDQTVVTSVGLDPDALDSYTLTGPVVDYSIVPSAGSSASDDATVDVSLDGTTTTFAELVGEEDSTDDGSTDDGSSDDGGSSGDDSSSDDSESDDGAAGGSGLPYRLTVDATGSDGVTKYTFTVSGDVARDAGASQVNGGGTPWDRMEDIARDGKVIGIVGDGVDAYRFSGSLTALTVDGDADVDIER
jgi:hypothetical protein